MWYLPKKKRPKPENSKTVRQLGRMGLIPLDDAIPNYLWDIHTNSGKAIVTTVYFRVEDTRPMTKEERETFNADPKAFGQKYADFYTELLRRKEKK